MQFNYVAEHRDMMTAGVNGWINGVGVRALVRVLIADHFPEQPATAILGFFTGRVAQFVIEQATEFATLSAAMVKRHHRHIYCEGVHNAYRQECLDRVLPGIQRVRGTGQRPGLCLSVT